MEDGQEVREKGRQPRFCPLCGARVAEGAKTCLMCGASLDEASPVAESPVAQRPRGRRLERRQMMILAGVAAVVLGGAIAIGLAAPEREAVPMTPTPVLSPSPSPTPTLTPIPSPTPSPQPTATPLPPQRYTVQKGDTLLSIAAEFGMTVDELRAYNGMDSDIIVVGQEILIPPPTPTPGPTPTWDPALPTPTLAPFVLHTVARGETLSALAEEYGVTVGDIRRANNLAEDDTVIRAGQVLQIPQYTPTPVATPAVVKAGTPTPRPLYPAPILLYPPEGKHFYGREARIVLQWAAVDFLAVDENYRLVLRCPAAEGEKEAVVEQKATLWRVPSDLFPPPEGRLHTCRWSVVIVRQDGTRELSQPGEERTFFWEPTSQE